MNRLLVMMSLLLVCMLVLGGGVGIWLFWPDDSTSQATPIPDSPTTIPHATPIPTSAMISTPTPDVAPTMASTPTPDVAPTPTPDMASTPTPDMASTPTPDVTPTPDSNQMLNP